jgi:hypothetical protein
MKKKLLILFVLIALPISVSWGQTPITGLAAGGLFENGADAHFLVKGDVRQNLKTWTNEAKETKFQTYIRAGFTRGNDIGLNPDESQKLYGIDGIGMLEYYPTKNIFVGVGYGRAWELEDTVTIEVPVYSGILGWQPAKEIRLYAGADYYKREDRFPNIIGVYFGLAFDLMEMIE